MSNEKENEYFTLNEGNKPNEFNLSCGFSQQNCIYKIVYTTKINIDFIKEIYIGNHFYYNDEDVALRIFGKNFVKTNSNKCKIIYKNKIYQLKEFFNEIDINYKYKYKDIIKLKLFGVDNIIDMNRMFFGCYHLESVSEYSTRNKYQDNSYASQNFYEYNSYPNVSSENQLIPFDYNKYIYLSEVNRKSSLSNNCNNNDKKPILIVIFQNYLYN